MAKSPAHVRAARRSWEKTADRSARTANARAAADARFARLVDPDGVLPEDQRAELAAIARRAHLTEISRKAAQARARYAAERKAAAEASA